MNLNKLNYCAGRECMPTIIQTKISRFQSYNTCRAKITDLYTLHTHPDEYCKSLSKFSHLSHKLTLDEPIDSSDDIWNLRE